MEVIHESIQNHRRNSPTQGRLYIHSFAAPDKTAAASDSVVQYGRILPFRVMQLLQADCIFFTSQDAHNSNICGSMRGIAQNLDTFFPDAIHRMNETLSSDAPILCSLSSDEILEHLRFYSSTLKLNHM